MRVKAEFKAGTENMTRAKRYRVIRFRMGLCVNCGKPRNPSPDSPSPYLRVCVTCGKKKTKKRTKNRGGRPWREGSPGRPPKAYRPQVGQPTVAQKKMSTRPINERTRVTT